MTNKHGRKGTPRDRILRRVLRSFDQRCNDAAQLLEARAEGRRAPYPQRCSKPLRRREFRLLADTASRSRHAEHRLLASLMLDWYGR